MKPAKFSYEAPTTLQAALATLSARRDEAKIIAGGQSLAPMMNMRLAQPGHLVDINGIEELGTIAGHGEHIVVGALVRHADLARHPLVRAHCPILAAAANSIGHYAIRQRGTLGGSLAHADPAAQLPVVALVLDADLYIASASGRRTVPASQFFISMFTTALAPDEVLTAVGFPVTAPHEGWGFRLFARRVGDFALALVATTLTRSNGRPGNLRLAVGGMGPTPVRLEAAADQLLATSGEPGWAIKVARAVATTADIEPNERVPVDYRRDLVAALVEDAVNDALERAR